MIIHLKGLLEIRGIAALLVLIAHIDQFHELLHLDSIGFSNTGIAGHAVTVFFTLSGFLITYLLLIEKKINQKINVKKFYIRRILRIWPAYYLTILFSLILIFVGLFSTPSLNNLMISLGGYTLMTPNVLYTFGLTLAGTSQLWSVGVEEQFYLIWPLVINKISNIKIFLLGLIAFYILVKLIAFVSHPTGGAYTFIRLTRFDCMAFGSLVPILLKKDYKGFFSFIYQPITQLVAVAVLISPFVMSIDLFASLDIEIYAIASTVWITNITQNPKSFMTVKSSVLRFFGKISYGIYVYHLLIIYLIGFLNLGLNTLFTYLTVLLTVSSFATLSYYLVERKFIKLKESYAVIPSHG